MKLTELLDIIRPKVNLIEDEYYSLTLMTKESQLYTVTFQVGDEVNLPDNIILDRVQLVRGSIPKAFTLFDEHHWLLNVREMSRILRSEIIIPHVLGKCNICDEARHIQQQYLKEKIRQVNELADKHNLAHIF